MNKITTGIGRQGKPLYITQTRTQRTVRANITRAAIVNGTHKHRRPGRVAACQCTSADNKYIPYEKSIHVMEFGQNRRDGIEVKGRSWWMVFVRPNGGQAKKSVPCGVVSCHDLSATSVLHQVANSSSSSS